MTAALHQTFETARPVEAEVRAMIERIVVNQGGDRDDGMTDRAVAAYLAGGPAFYTTARYSHATACCLCNTANLTRDVIAAVRTEFGFHRSDADRERGLHTLVPLNMAGAEALSAAYHRYGVWRDADELLARRDRIAVAA